MGNVFSKPRTTEYAERDPHAGVVINPLAEWEYNSFEIDNAGIYFSTFTSCIGLVVLHKGGAIAIHMGLYANTGKIDNFGKEIYAHVKMDRVIYDIVTILSFYKISPGNINHVLLFGIRDCWVNKYGVTILTPIRNLFNGILTEQDCDDGKYVVSIINGKLTATPY